MTNSILTKLLKIFIIFLSCLVGYIIIKFTFPYFLPLLLAILIALCIEPAVQLFVKRLKIPRAAASIAIIVCIIFLLIGFLILIITEIYQGVTFLAEFLPEQLHTFGIILDYYLHQFIMPLYENVLTLFNQLADTEQLMIQDYITNLFALIAQWTGAFFQEILFSIPSLFTIIPESFTTFIFTLLASVIISADLPNLKRMFNTAVPEKINGIKRELTGYLKLASVGFIKAQLILVSITFFIILTGLFILQVEHALTIAFIMLIIDLIPYVGTGLLFLPWLIYCFLTGNYTLTIGLSIVYAIVILSRQFIEPKILSANMGIHPLAWLIVAFFGFKLWGIAGLLLAPFILVFLKSLVHVGVFQALYRFIIK